MATVGVQEAYDQGRSLKEADPPDTYTDIEKEMFYKGQEDMLEEIEEDEYNGFDL